MILKDRILALAIVIAWGVNFVVIKVGLEGMPPLLLAGLRFALVAFPAVFFISRPRIPIKLLFIYGLTISFGQFALLFWALKAGLPAGLASLILQAQAFFTLIFSAVILKEKIRAISWIALIVAALGITLLASAQDHGSAPVTIFTLLLTLGAASSWALGNITNKFITRYDGVNSMSLIVWGAIAPACMFIVSSYVFEGGAEIINNVAMLQWHNMFAIVYLSLLATLLGYGGWSYLLSRYPTSSVAPLSLLVPVFGLMAGYVFLGEQLNITQVLGVIVVVAGLCLNFFGPVLVKKRQNSVSPAEIS